MKDLTGVWEQVGGGTGDKGEYYFRQVGDKFYGTGQPASGLKWKNVFCGTVKGNTIDVKWADVAGGTNRGSGVLTLTVSENGDTIDLTSQVENYFGGKKWNRE